MLNPKYQNKTRSWQIKHSTKNIVDHHQQYRQTLKAYFDSLKHNKDVDYIMISELEDPLITLGLAKNRKEVREIVQQYDDNGNGKIEFDEFLDILDGKLHSQS